MRLRAPRAITLPPLASSVRGRSTARRGWSIWAYRSLIWNFTQRDLKARYKGTALGWAWSLVVPLATLLIYTLVFSVIFRAEPPDFGNGEPGIFPVWLFGGLIAWNFLAQSIQLGSRRCSATDPCSRRSTSRHMSPSWGPWVRSLSRR